MKKILTWVFLLLFILGGVALCFVVDNHSYPVKYKQKVFEEAGKYNLDPVLIFSIINVESGYDEQAISSAGAMGLMQIMPLTAQEVAKKLNIKDFKTEDLFVPERNIEIGCFYVNYLFQLFDGNLNNVLAAYNAGLSNVNKWLKIPEYSQDGVVLNSTPYTETNSYIKKIHKNIKKYQLKI